MNEVPANPFAVPDGPPPDPAPEPTPPPDPASPYGQSAGVPAYGTPPDSPPAVPPPYSSYAAPSYGPPGTLPPYGQPNVAPQRTNGLAVASMIVGIASIVMCALVLPAIVGLVLGVVALNQTKDGRSGGRGMAIAGVVTSAVGLALFTVFLVVGLVVDRTDEGYSYSSCGQVQTAQVVLAGV